MYKCGMWLTLSSIVCVYNDGRWMLIFFLHFLFHLCYIINIKYIQIINNSYVCILFTDLVMLHRQLFLYWGSIIFLSFFLTQIFSLVCDVFLWYYFVNFFIVKNWIRDSFLLKLLYTHAFCLMNEEIIMNVYLKKK